MTTALDHLAATGGDRLHTAGYAVTLLDFSSRAPLGAFSGPRPGSAAPPPLEPASGTYVREGRPA